MKKSILYNLIGLLVFFVACNPIENRDKLGDITPASEFEYSITQDPQRDYIVYLENKTPKVLFSWDYAWGLTTRQKIRFIFWFRVNIQSNYCNYCWRIVFDEHEIVVTS